MPTKTSHEEQATGLALVVALARAMKNISFYDAAHRVVQDVLVGLHADLTGYLADHSQLSVRFVTGYLLIQDLPVVSPYAPVGNLLGACHRRRAESIVFRRGVALDELTSLVTALVTDPSELDKGGGINRVLEARGVEHITIGCRAETQNRDWRLVHSTALDVLRGAALGLRTGRPVDVAGVQGSAREVIENVLGDRSLLHHLTALRGADEYTFVHALNICVLSAELGRQMKLDRARLVELGMGALLHDVGKILVPLEILRKPGALDQTEFEVMSQHPADGAAMLLREAELPESSAVIAFEHHMRRDLSGYPKTARPRELHLYSLMACIADIYDALTTMRPYRPPLTPRRALEVMERECKAHVEPGLFRQFLAMLGPYPWGTLLGLPDGRLAVVTRPNAAVPEDPYARAINADAQPPTAAGTEVPVGHLAGPGGEITVLDPVDLGLDLTAVLHRVHAAEHQDAAEGTQLV